MKVMKVMRNWTERDSGLGTRNRFQFTEKGKNESFVDSGGRMRWAHAVEHYLSLCRIEADQVGWATSGRVRSGRLFYLGVYTWSFKGMSKTNSRVQACHVTRWEAYGQWKTRREASTNAGSMTLEYGCCLWIVYRSIGRDRISRGVVSSCCACATHFLAHKKCWSIN